MNDQYQVLNIEVIFIIDLLKLTFIEIETTPYIEQLSYNVSLL